MTERSVGPSGVQRVHIDTDPGLDDLLALALAFASPELDVVGITTVAGNAPLDVVTDNTRRFVALSGLDVEIGRGAEGPISLHAAAASDFHGKDGRGGVQIPAIDGHSVGPARELLRRNLIRGLDRIVALGPLTNIALLARDEPELLRRTEVVWMGGSLGCGNVTAVAEFNAYADPAALSLLFHAGIPLRIVPLEVTETVALRPAELPRDPFGTTQMGKTLASLLRALMDAEHPNFGEPLAVLHDPCAVMACIDVGLFRYESKTLEVTIEESSQRGQLIELPSNETATVRYAAEARVADLKQMFLDRISAWAAEGP